MANVHNVAAAVIERLGPITAMKLQKIVYYCQCWHLAREDEKLFPDSIEAWRQGPVVQALWQRHRQMYSIRSWPHGDPSALTSSEARTVKWVCDHYGGFTPVELSRMTHNELPWIIARGTLPHNETSNTELSCEIMANFYGRQLADPESSINHAVANAAIEGHELDSEWQERLRDVALGVVTADELIAQEIAKITND